MPHYQHHFCDRLFLVLLAAFLHACHLPLDLDEDPVRYLSSGVAIELNQTITIPADSASIYIQGGKILPYPAIDQYYPHCKFESRLRLEESQQIDADRFTVERVRLDGDYAWLGIFSDDQEGISLASDGPSPQNYAILIYLYSAQQPQILRLVCSHWEDPVDAEFLTIRQIKTTLGNIITINGRVSPSG